LKKLVSEQRWLVHLNQSSKSFQARQVFSQNPVLNLNHLTTFVKLSHCQTVGRAIMRSSSIAGILYTLSKVTHEFRLQKNEGLHMTNKHTLIDVSNGKPQDVGGIEAESVMRARIQKLYQTIREHE
jgi:hypothetical protein